MSLATKGPGQDQADRCRGWISDVRALGYTVVIPEIADYELRRELLRRGEEARDWLGRLDLITATLPYLPITTQAMKRAAYYWSLVRNQGLPTAGAESLDADAILAAQATTAAQPADTVIIATTHVGHLERFPGVKAEPWDYVARP